MTLIQFLQSLEKHFSEVCNNPNDWRKHAEIVDLPFEKMVKKNIELLKNYPMFVSTEDAFTAYKNLFELRSTGLPYPAYFFAELEPRNAVAAQYIAALESIRVSECSGTAANNVLDELLSHRIEEPPTGGTGGGKRPK